MKNLFVLLLVLGFSSISFASEDLASTDGTICADRSGGKTIIKTDDSGSGVKSLGGASSN